MTFIQLCVITEGLGGFNLLLLLKNLACISALAVYMYLSKLQEAGILTSQMFVLDLYLTFFKRRISVTLCKKLQPIFCFL